ncbi:hypothetical protein NQ314_001288 [Rhamnusium bicolor]|uniref:5-formyltetrahydrofolate cyclo-ligase n=1 Tax=Rhamnusium bicolor TaxID=1586634 RepID=A0AAV8ZU85_9CUCU|nr:hypothetical protein NQ314_001288 [Rhamnusium bicolor]
MEMVKLYSMEDWRTLPVTKWNIKQPSLKDVRENAMESVPGVAFTTTGLRLGHGAGYYDKYLMKVKEIQNVAPVIIGLAFKEQIVDEVPIEATDIQIDTVLYPD